MPLICHDKIVGSMALASLRESAFTDEDAELLTQIGTQVAIAVDKAQNFERLECAQSEVARERDRKQLLLKINNAVVAHLDLRELLKSVSASLRRIIPHDGAFFTLLDSDRNRLSVQALDLQILDRVPFEEGISISPEGTPEGEAIASGRAVPVTPVIDYTRFHNPWVRARLKMEERVQLSDIQNLYVYAMQGSAKGPLTQVSKIEHSMETERIIRLDHFRTIAVRCFPRPGVLSSEVLKAAGPKLRQFEKNLPPGYKIRIGGDYYRQHRGFGELSVVMAASVFLIFLALVFQFNNAVKPFLVFAAAPYGVVGAVAALWAMGTPFGFMAFLGVASLIGVIVSHVIVLFDFIEEKREEGEPFEEAVVDAGIIRLRPVMITVGATVLALFPLALHGGPLWQPLCYTQIGGLCVATFITLLLVPVLYAIFVLDLKIL